MIVIDSLTLGAEGFSVDSGIDLTEETHQAMLIARMKILFAARAKLQKYGMKFCRFSLKLTKQDTSKRIIESFY